VNDIAAHFAALRAAHRPAFIPFLTAGFPDRDTFRRLLAATHASADFVEIGIPFSDPVADGPSIQAASEQALAHGMHVEAVFDVLAAERARPPCVLMTYANPVLAYGVEPFVRRAREAGVAGVLFTDVPVEEGVAWRRAAEQAGLGVVQLVAPTTAEARLPDLVAAATAFVYCVSRTGTTGARAELAATARDTVERVRRVTTNPVVVGFGVSTPEQAARVCEFADGVVVGSALVDFIAAHAHDADLAAAFARHCATFAAAVHASRA
jgi:tryptophan synthase alpha chain